MNESSSVALNVAKENELQLSVLVPFRNDNPLPLARELLAQVQRTRAQIELLFADDGSDHRRHAAALLQLLRGSTIPHVVLEFEACIGRAAVRNRLVCTARAEYLLLMDADMLPDADDYLQVYLDYCQKNDWVAVYGGRSMRRLEAVSRRRQLSHYLSTRTECLSAAARADEPWRYLHTNNLLVKRQALLDRPFNEHYSGWGFEDADWALSIPRQLLHHIENSATHLGVETDDVLLQKIEHSAENFTRISRHQAFRASRMYRISRWFARLGRVTSRALILLAPLFRTLVRQPLVPLRCRYYVLQTYRAMLYGAALNAWPGYFGPDAGNSSGPAV